jgi:serine/threonine-protein kinase
MSDTPAPPADLVAGKYRLVRLLGRGGMGSVWEGVHASLGTRVAVKFIEAELASSAEARARFENEARAAARLRTRFAVEIHDHGVMPDGRPFIVMEFLDGESLESRLARRGALEVAATARVVAQVAKALMRAREAGIVHRDLKPENIFLARSPDDDDEVAKVVDFGVAKFTAPTLAPSASTRTGVILGTPFYMSPEQARGLKTIDHRSDVWALGVVAYRCVTGRLPFEGEAVGDLLVKICTQDPVSPSKLDARLDARLDAWFARVLAREPQDRFQTASEAASALLVVAGLPEAAASLGSGASEAARVAAMVPAQAALAPTQLSDETAAAAGGGGTRMDATLGGRVPGRGRGLLFGLAAVAVALAAAGVWALWARRSTSPPAGATGAGGGMRPDAVVSAAPARASRSLEPAAAAPQASAEGADASAEAGRKAPAGPARLPGKARPPDGVDLGY